MIPTYVRSLLQSLGDAKLQDNTTIVFWSAVFALLCITALWVPRSSNIPTINVYSWDLLGRKARQAYESSAKRLLQDGLAKYNGPFRIVTNQGSRIILPSSYTDWAKQCQDLDHQALVHDDFFASYSGFDGLALVTNPNRILIDVTRIKLSQNAQSIQVMSQQATRALKELWTDNTDWHELNWAADTMSLISQMSASIFVGSQLATDPEWQNLTITYTVNMFNAVGALRRWPSFLRRFVHLVSPQSEICREQVQLARKKVQAIINQRQNEKSAATESYQKYEDMITWLDEVADGRSYDPATAQLGLAISALHTTSEAFRQVLLDLCIHTDLLPPVREEIENAISEHGWTVAALSKMQLLDSIMKESQRFKSAIVGIERKVIRNTTLPNGMKLPRGSNIAVDSSDMWSTDVHINPTVFDGYRFLRMRQQGGKGLSFAPFASSTKEHNTFGAGRFICPGRFFVANEVKIALTHILLKYDIRLVEGYILKDVQVGFYPSTDLAAKVEVRRRD